MRGRFTVGEDRLAAVRLGAVSTNYHLRDPYLRWRNKIDHEDLFWTQQMARVLPWFKFGLAFWRPFIEAEGYELPSVAP